MNATARFSTRLVPAQRRHLFWRDVIADAFPGMTARAPEGIRADLACWSLGAVGLARARSSRAQVSRVARGGAPRHLLFHLLHRGRLAITQRGDMRTAGVGDLVVADDACPYEIDISEENDCLILQVPVAMLRSDVAGRDWHGRVLPACDPNVAFLRHMLETLSSRQGMFDEIDDGFGALLADAAGIACRRRPVDMAEPSGPPSPVAYALRNLGDRELGTAVISAATGLSARAVQKAFVRHTASTPTAYITERRLARAIELLALDDGRSITDIAFEIGFGDSAFFSRCFSRRYGVAPSRWRASGARIPS